MSGIRARMKCFYLYVVKKMLLDLLKLKENLKFAFSFNSEKVVNF